MSIRLFKSIRHSAAVFCAVYALSVSFPLSATTILGMDIDAMASDAELVFEGQVLEHNVQENAAGIVVTYVTFQINDVIKGSYSDSYLELKFTGGTYQGQIVEVSGLRIPKLDEQGIYFVESVSEDLVNPLLGWSQGHFLIVDNNGDRKISTINLRPVTDVMRTGSIPRSIKRPQPMLDGDVGAAIGIVTDAGPFQFDQAMTVEDFKTRIRQFVD